MTRIAFVCTSNLKYLDTYAGVFFDDLAQKVADANVILYTEDSTADVVAVCNRWPFIEVRPLPQTLHEFKRRYDHSKYRGEGWNGIRKGLHLFWKSIIKGRSKKLGRLFYNFYYDALRFSHKSFAIVTALEDAEINTTLIYLDTDIRINKKCSSSDILMSITRDAKRDTLYYYNRPTFPESGVILFHGVDKDLRSVAQNISSIYTTGQIFDLQAYTDCHVLAAVKKIQPFIFIDVSNGIEMDPINTLSISEFLRHEKGEHKL